MRPTAHMPNGNSTDFPDGFSDRFAFLAITEYRLNHAHDEAVVPQLGYKVEVRQLFNRRRLLAEDRLEVTIGTYPCTARKCAVGKLISAECRQ
jgi:hypothetical protein